MDPVEEVDEAPNVDLSDRLKKLEDTIKSQIEQVEDELNTLNHPLTQNNDAFDKPSPSQQKNTNLQQLRHLQTYSSLNMSNEFNRFNKASIASIKNTSNLNDNNNSSDTDGFLNNDSNISFPAKTSRVIRSSTFDNQNISSCWEQVLSFLHQGKDEEALYALVRVVQRLVDEKASKRTQQEKASKSYVDSLYERVLGNVKENLTQQVMDSYDDLENQVISITKQIGELKQFFQKELRDVTIQIAVLKEDNDAVNDSNTGSNFKNTGRSSGRSSSRARSAFSVFSAKG